MKWIKVRVHGAYPIFSLDEKTSFDKKENERIRGGWDIFMTTSKYSLVPGVRECKR